jgi:plastocyanin
LVLGPRRRAITTRASTRTALAVALVTAGAAAPALAQPGTIRGRVDVRRESTPPPTRPNLAEIGPGAPVPAIDRRRSVVYLEAAPQGAFEEPERARVVLDQRNQTFVPHVLAVTTGTTVDFLNSDRTYHNVFSLSKAKRFDLGRYPRSQTRSVRFDRPGVVRVFCDIHSHMSAFILVFAHRYFAVTEPDGTYRIDRVPAGSYSLVAWNEGQERETRPVDVPAGGSVEADFTLR